MASSIISSPSAPTSPLSSPPSSPLSSLSRSPTPPKDYPSPPVSNLSDQETPLAIQVAMPEGYDRDGPPPAKKRKITEKPRTTEKLDLRSFGECSDQARVDHQNCQLKRLVETLRKKRKIVVVAGAGISVSAGIPDFRSSTGLFTTLRSQHKLKSSGKELFDASVYRNDSSTTSFHSMVRELAHLTQNAQPTPFHHMLASLAEEGRLMRLYTQNVDGIDTSMKPLVTKVPLNVKGPWPKSVQLHGGLEKMVCSKCGTLSDFDGTLFEGPEAPSCPECTLTDEVRVVGGLRSHGIGCLRPRMVLYNEFNPDSDAIGAVSHADLRSRPDAVIVVGTSLKIPGIRRLVREICGVTRGCRGGLTAWINLDEPATEFKDCWDLVVRGESDEVARHVNLPKWDDKDHENFSLVTSDEERENVAKGVDLKVEVPSANIPEAEIPELRLDVPQTGSIPVVVIKSLGLNTPGASPREQSPSQVNAFSKLKQPTSQDAKSLGLKLTKTGAARKKPGPKPGSKPAKKSVETGNTINGALKVSKTSSITTAKPKQPAKQAEPSKPSKAQEVLKEPTSTIKQEASLFPGLSTKRMEPISPTNPRVNADLQPTTTTKTFDDSLASLSSAYHTALETPTPRRYSDSALHERKETISPKSIPSGMAHLLDA